MYHLIIRDKFDAAHHLPNHTGNCANLHGHTWNIEVKLQFEKVNENGMCRDFVEVKKIIRDCLPNHCYLNEIYSFIPTAENIACHLFQQIGKYLPVLSITIWESENCGATYHE